MQIRELERSAADRDEMISSMQRTHDEQLEKLASIAEGRTQQWQQQKAEMEQHYTQLMAEVQARHKVRGKRGVIMAFQPTQSISFE